MLVIKNSHYKFKQSRSHEIFEEKLKKETSFQFMAVLVTNLPKLRCLLSLATGALAQLTKDEDISYLSKKIFLTFARKLGAKASQPPFSAMPEMIP